MPRLKIYISYDGTHYSGWQRQKSTPNTIQEALENKLSMIANTRVTVMASGRTDAGVHARVQVVHADVPDAAAAMVSAPDKSGTIGPRLQQGLNSLLPPDVRVLKIEVVPDEFHAIRDVQKKTYVYFIDPSPVQAPELRDHSWHLRLPLDWAAMEEGAKLFVGEHDFKAFADTDTAASTTVRTVFEARWGTHHWSGLGGAYPLRVFRVTGSGFLKHMVRSLVGTLAHVGNGRTGVETLRKALETGDRSLAGPTAPSRGLWLWDILYSKGPPKLR